MKPAESLGPTFALTPKGRETLGWEAELRSCRGRAAGAVPG